MGATKREGKLRVEGRRRKKFHRATTIQFVKIFSSASAAIVTTSISPLGMNFFVFASRIAKTTSSSARMAFARMRRRGVGVRGMPLLLHLVKPKAISIEINQQTIEKTSTCPPRLAWSFRGIWVDWGRRQSQEGLNS